LKQFSLLMENARCRLWTEGERNAGDERVDRAIRYVQDTRQKSAALQAKQKSKKPHKLAGGVKT
jgi:hypothetical protein